MRALVTDALSSISHLDGILIALDRVRIPSALAKTSMKILIRFEGPTSSPLSHTNGYARNFHKVIDVGSSSDKPWPVSGVNFDFIQQPNRESKASMVLANKLSFSTSQMYSLRRRFTLESQIVVRGTGWLAPPKERAVIAFKALAVGLASRNLDLHAVTNWFSRYPASAGPILDKWSFSSQFHTSLVIENDDSRVTEKLFDALAAGCYVVYVGASLEGLSPRLMERVLISNADVDEINLVLARSLSKKWEAPSQAFVSELKAHYSEAAPRCLAQIKLELGVAKNLWDQEQKLAKTPFGN
jgi:hypothetical protein